MLRSGLSETGAKAALRDIEASGFSIVAKDRGFPPQEPAPTLPVPPPVVDLPPGAIPQSPEEAKARRWPTWSADKQPGDKPPDFIKRHYGQWVGNGLTRRHVRKADPSLETAIANWLRGGKNAFPPDCPLPTEKEITDARVAAALAGGTSKVALGSVLEKTAIKRLGWALADREKQERKKRDR